MQELIMFLQQLVLQLFKPKFLIPIIIIIIIVILILIKKDRAYKNGAYYKITKQPYYSVKHDTGRYGEYLTYKHLKYFETDGAKFLFNIYLPKKNGETTEIDVLMICKKGIFVFESKNYSGWIFGSEDQKNWYQTLPTGRGRSNKEHFYNPIMQNRSHIKHLKTCLGGQLPMRSIIVFSDRCTLKSVQIHSEDISVINRYNVAQIVYSICKQIPNDVLTHNDVIEIYNKLYPYTQVDESVKRQHITNIHRSIDATNEAPIVKIVETATADAEQQAIKCPKCNGVLIMRTATRGANAGKQFYGCSNYPKCKYIKNITK